VTRFALATGGTAGHIYPAVAVAEELRRRGIEVLFLGTMVGWERELLESAAYRIERLPGRPFQRTSLLGKVRALLAIAPAVLAARRLLRANKIDAVIGFGGYAAVGPILAARSLGIWNAILEPNTVLGMANRMLARFANRIYTGALTQSHSSKSVRVGLPVRSEIIAASSRRAASHNARLRVLRFDDGLSLNVDAEVIRPGEDVAAAYAACDLVVGRAGAGTLAEVSICGLPEVIVPMREAAEDHQTRNARIYEERGAAVVTDEHHLGDAVSFLLSNESERRAIGDRARMMAMPGAGRDLVSDAIDALRC
jgi:UDP-N-acetylglucosamine--N-acetylmuramyl-(pentapeptide) pyrophosphoryl-undecaprenol N-acetylglucosamine transferase